MDVHDAAEDMIKLDLHLSCSGRTLLQPLTWNLKFGENILKMGNPYDRMTQLHLWFLEECGNQAFTNGTVIAKATTSIFARFYIVVCKD